MVVLKIGKKTVDLPYTVRIPDVSEKLFDELAQDEDLKAELINGVMVMPMPAHLIHDDISGFVRALMSFFADEMGLGDVLGPDSIVHLATCRKFCPDTYFVRKGTLSRPLPKEFHGVPQLVLEVLSEHHRADDLDDKLPAYQAAGVAEIWYIDPEKKELRVYRKQRRSCQEEVLRSGKVSSAVLRGFWIDVAWLWKAPLPNRLTCLNRILRSAKTD